MCVFSNMSEQIKCVKRTNALYDLHHSADFRACAVMKLTGLVDVAQQLGDFDEAGHCAL